MKSRITRRLASHRKGACATAHGLQRASKLVHDRWLPTPIPGHILSVAQRCVAAADVHVAIDEELARNSMKALSRCQFLIAISDIFRNRGDRMTALHFLAVAREMLTKGRGDAIRQALAMRFLDLGQAEPILDLIQERGLEAARWLSLDQKDLINSSWRKMRASAELKHEHGHDLLLSYFKHHSPQVTEGTRPLLIEVGTTRESVTGQGSTAKLAEACLQLGMRFITVDMDPHNSAMARSLFIKMGADFESVTAKGEEYLKGFNGGIDYVFLDAYDFDHGNHSELRQSRYQNFLGARINDDACHQMHLQCAQVLARKLNPFGVICIDDTWLENGRWAAKGTLAMPFLLANGFDVVETRNRAAMLRRKQGVA